MNLTRYNEYRNRNTTNNPPLTSNEIRECLEDYFKPEISQEELKIRLFEAQTDAEELYGTLKMLTKHL